MRWPTSPPGAIPSRRSVTGDRARSSTTSNTQTSDSDSVAESNASVASLSTTSRTSSSTGRPPVLPRRRASRCFARQLAIPIVPATEDRAGPDHRNVAKGAVSSGSVRMAKAVVARCAVFADCRAHENACRRGALPMQAAGVSRADTDSDRGGRDPTGGMDLTIQIVADLSRPQPEPPSQKRSRRSGRGSPLLRHSFPRKPAVRWPMEAVVRQVMSASRGSACGSSGGCSRPPRAGKTTECVG